MTIFVKHSILDLWQGSEHASGLLKLLCRASKSNAQKGWYIQTDYSIRSKLRNFPYS